MKNNFKKDAFTFIELIVSVIIIAVLSTIWFVSYFKYLEDARDSQRKTELTWVATSLKSHKAKRWEYPNPWESFFINNWSNLVAKQWRLVNNIIIFSLDKIPYDPYINVPYFYSVSRINQEFQLAATLENNWVNLAFVVWDYQSVMKTVAPNIILAHESWDIDLSEEHSKRKIIFDNSNFNLPYIFSLPYSPSVNADISLEDMLNSPNKNWEQNWDFRSCEEIKETWKNIWNWQYQINSWWVTINSNCIF